MMKQEIRRNFPRITENALIEEIAEQGILKKFEAGENIITVGEYINVIPLFLSGSVKVSRINNEGEEIFLYYLQEGDTCADTLQCCFTNKKSRVNVEAVTSGKFLLVDIRAVNLWASNYKSWNQFIMLSFKDKFNQLLETIDAIAFQKIDERLLSYLKEKQQVLNTTEVAITHQDIAYDLNTSREVISRLLKTMEKKNLVALGRNRIQIL